MVTNIDKIKDLIRSGGNIVVLGGIGVTLEAGLNGVRAEHIAYDIEEKYGYSSEEITSTLFYARRTNVFYDYYKDIILNKENIEPSVVHRGVAKLQQCGKLDMVITRMVYDLYRKAGCSSDKVISLHGSVEENRCQSCGKYFGSDYIRHSVGIPKCDVCNVPIRPGFSLVGEMIDNGKISRASRAVENARILLILGASVNSPLCKYMVKYYNGDQMIVINDRERPGDNIANYKIYGNLSEIFSYVMDF